MDPTLLSLVVYAAVALMVAAVLLLLRDLFAAAEPRKAGTSSPRGLNLPAAAAARNRRRRRERSPGSDD